MTDQLKTARASAKRAVTKQVNYFRQKIAADEIDSIEDEVGKLKDLFSKFDEATSQYQSALQTDDDIDKCEAYFDQVQNRFIKVLEQVKSLRGAPDVKPCVNGAGTTVSDAGPASAANVDLSVLLGAMNLPKVELAVFSGDPSCYHQFIKSFDLNVHDVSIDDAYKLTRLLQYTPGPAKEAIQGCILVNGSEGYKHRDLFLRKDMGIRF